MSFQAKSVPVLIISYNRLSYLRRLVTWLERAGYDNLHIVDNDSKYPPLLEYLAASRHTVHRMDKNYGHLVVWKSKRFDDIIANQFYVVTDCDVLPANGCPTDLVEHFYRVLERYPAFTKVGLSLKIDDLPDHYYLKPQVVEWESAFWKHPLENSTLFEAAIDTTFALYRPGIWASDKQWWRSIRTAPPYVARHLPWYVNGKTSEEDLFYQRSLNSFASQWSITDPKLLKEENMRLLTELKELRSEIEIVNSGFVRYQLHKHRPKIRAALDKMHLTPLARIVERLVLPPQN